MMRKLSGAIAVAACLLLATATVAAPVHKKRHPKHPVTRHWHGYGYLPGYRSPERIEWERAHSPGPFSNRPFGVKHFQTIHHCSVDVAHGLALLFGLGTKALPSWDSKTRGTIYWTALPSDEWQVQATKRTHLIHRPARDIIPPLGGARVFSYRN